MGYTHYWKKTDELDKDVWEKEFIPIASSIMKESGVALGDDLGKVDSKPNTTSDVLSFNGISPMDFETFSLTRNKEEFSFCKTSSRPYDKVCVAILMLADDVFDDFSWSSDGNAEDHKEGKELLGCTLEVVRGENNA